VRGREAGETAHDHALARRREHDREGEDHGLEPLAPDGLEAEQAEPPARPPVERGLGARAELRGEPAGVAAHPEGHVREDGAGQQVGGGLEDRLGPRARIRLEEQVGGDATAEDQHHRGRDPGQDVAEVPALADLVEVGEEDRDDHAGLDPLAEEDDERGDHVLRLT
jgi:hypothetical protein